MSEILYYLSDRQNEHGYFEVRWTEGTRSRRKSTGTGDRRLAQRVLAETILASSTPEDDGAPSLTVDDVLVTYTEEKGFDAIHGAHASHCRAILSHFGGLRIAAIAAEDVKAYVRLRSRGALSWTLPSGRVSGGRVAKSAAIRRELGMLNAAINHLIKSKRFDRKFAPYIDLPPDAPARDVWLRRDEARRLLEKAQPPEANRLTRGYRYITACLFTASRKEPVISLPWARIFLDVPTPYVDLQDPTRRRTRKRRGKVTLSDELVGIMRRAYDERTSEWYLDAPTEPKGEFRAAVKAAGIAKATPHTLRHTWATWAAQDGVPMFKIAGVLHDTVKTVEARYAHHVPEHLRDAVNRDMLGTTSVGATMEREGREREERFNQRRRLEPDARIMPG